MPARMMSTMKALLPMALLAALAPMPASAACALPAGVEVTEEDAGRLDRFETSRTRGLAQALAADSAADRRVLSDLFGGGVAPPDPSALAGAYRCRTIKAGGNLPLTVYGWFRCEIAPDSGGLAIRKTTGSQQFSGALYPAEDGTAYRGASHYGDERPRLYGDDAEENQVGCLSRVPDAAGHYVLELPEPQRESLHDVIELRRD